MARAYAQTGKWSSNEMLRFCDGPLAVIWMHRGTILAIGISAIAAAVPAPALAREDEQLWTAANANVKLGDKWRLQQELITRFSDNRNGLYEVESVTLLGYRLAKNVTLAGGYVHNPQYSGGDFTVMEHRFREQITFDNVLQVGPGKLSARMRVEQRWREHIDGTGWRLRPYVKYSMPLGKGSKTSLTLSNETFINLNRTPFQGQNGLDRMRNLIAINTPLTKTISAEVGYLNQHGFVRHGEDTSDNVLSLSLSLNL
jgi:hypothetical protein